MKVTPTQAAACLAAATALLGAGWIVQRSYDDGGPGVVLASRGGWSLLGAGKSAAPAIPLPTISAKDLQALRTAAFGDGPLAQIQPLGDWPIGERGELVPSVVLRQRFDFYLLAQANATAQDLHKLVVADAQAAVGAQQAAVIVDLFDRYWLLRSTASPGDQHARRQQVLGPIWADAFYKNEEAFLARMQADVGEADGAAQQQPGYPALPTMQMMAGPNPAALHAERVARHGEERARQMDEADAAWRATLQR